MQNRPSPVFTHTNRLSLDAPLLCRPRSPHLNCAKANIDGKASPPAAQPTHIDLSICKKICSRRHSSVLSHSKAAAVKAQQPIAHFCSPARNNSAFSATEIYYMHVLGSGKKVFTSPGFDLHSILYEEPSKKFPYHFVPFPACSRPSPIFTFPPTAFFSPCFISP